MKFIFDRDTMLKEISIAQEIISSKNALSILSNIFLSAENNSLIIKATDIKINFETKIPVEIEISGKTTVYCDKFISILNTLPQGDVEFIQDDINIVIRPITKKVKFQLKSMASDKFPEFSIDTDIKWIELPIEDFKEMINQTIFSVSYDQSRRFMNGIFFEKQEDNLIMVATDARRLSYIKKPLLNNTIDFENSIVPVKILSIILKRAPSEGMIEVAFSNKMIYIKIGHYYLSSVLIEGKFPDYKKVIPETQEKQLFINKKDLADALKRVGLLAEKKSGKLFFSISDGRLNLSAEEIDMGSAKEEIPIQYSGENIDIALNYSYIEDPIKIITTERIKIEFTNGDKVITVKAEPESDFLHIIMPMQK